LAHHDRHEALRGPGVKALQDGRMSATLMGSFASLDCARLSMELIHSNPYRAKTCVAGRELRRATHQLNVLLELRVHHR